MEQYDLEPGQGFEEVNADAVCEQCGAVNEEGTLLCKACGNNLRDQRNRRIAAGAVPDIGASSANRTQLLTGLLVLFGVLIVFYAVWNIETLEGLMVQAMSEDVSSIDENPWTGPNAQTYDELATDLVDNPTLAAVRRRALAEPQVESNYNGRYLLIPGGRLTTDRIIGEANLKRQGERILFVFRSDDGKMEARGYAHFEDVEETGTASPIVRETAEVRINGTNYIAMGLATPNPQGGHSVLTMRGDSDEQWTVLAYRVH